ncbi:MAG: hypothetical protein IPM98_15885 [Lewinellaceae bacterium]|nr:hypothetical protein [Lewinellaceae bacterium]
MKTDWYKNTFPKDFCRWLKPLGLFIFLWTSAGTSSVWAQPNTLYGYGSEGGAQGFGTLYKVQVPGGSIVKVFDFPKTEGAEPAHATLMQASNGKLYGVTGGGGANLSGVLFEYDPVAKSYSALYSFDYPTGAEPVGRLVESSGKLYGMTAYGGSGGRGVLYEYDLNTQTYAVKIAFSSNGDAADPRGSLTDLGGIFYGTTNAGGSESAGVLFSYDPNTNALNYWHHFGVSGAGAGPVGSLTVMGSKLYGTTEQGGANGQGVLYEFDPGTVSYTELYPFDGTTGGAPRGALLPDAGILYGTASQGGSNGAGVLFSYNTGTNLYATLHDFGFSDGAGPEGDLAIFSGKLYGMTPNGGGSNLGVLFEYNLGANAYQVLLEFQQFNTGNSRNGLLEIGGVLYGMTASPGKIFTYEVATATFTPLVSFLGAWRKIVRHDGVRRLVRPGRPVRTQPGKRRVHGAAPF